MNRRAWLAGAIGAAGCARDPRPRLNVYNWSNYVAPGTIPGFEREFGVRVRYANYESNEEMLAKVMSGNSGWDVVFPTNYYIEPMRAFGLLAPLRHEWLPHLRHLDAAYRRPPWDPDLRWGAPYMLGATGIVHHRSIQPYGWRDLWSERWRGRLTMLDDPAEVLGAALRLGGRSLNSTDEGELRAAQREAMRQKPLLRAYLNAEVRDQLVAGDVLCAQLWATTAQQAIDASPDLRFVYPAEGFPRYADCAVVLAESRRARLAHQFIDYLLRPEVAAAVVASSRTGTPNGSARTMLPPELLANRTLFPDGATLARAEWFAPMPAAAQRLRDRLWTEIKSG